MFSRKLLCSALLSLTVLGACSDDPGQAGVPFGDILLPDVASVDAVAPPVACTTDDQCALSGVENLCRAGKCDKTLGQCAIFEQPYCCASDADCDDGSADTIDRCDATLGTCTYEDHSMICTNDADCVTEALCQTFTCNGGFCTFWHTEGCCSSFSDCDDGDSCTVDACEDLTCTHVPSDGPGCCGTTILSATFEDDTLSGLTASGNGKPVAWLPSFARSHTGSGSARFGSPDAAETYGNPAEDGKVPPSQGTLASPTLTLADGDSLTLSLWIWVDVETKADYDLVSLQAQTGTASDTLWSKTELTAEQFRTWVQVSVDVTKYAGKPVTFAIVVDTLDGTQNKGEGVYVDDIALIQGCGAPPACEDGTCPDDGDVCTVEICGADGLCHSLPVAGCCKGGADCDDNDTCTEDFCVGGACAHTASPDCCSPTPLFQTSFDELALGVELENTNPLGGWTVDGANAHSPPKSLHYGDAAAGNYDFGGPSSGVARLPVTPIPAGTNAVLKFWVWLGIEAFPTTDLFELRVRANDAEPKSLWTKADVTDDQYQTWVPVTVDLSAFAGSNVRIVFRFDTVDGIENSGEGVYIDDLVVGIGCGDGCDLAKCDDGNPCTTDGCGADGECTHEAVPGCTKPCQSPLDCGDDDACTADFCVQGACSHVPVPGCGGCTSPAQCDDGDPCTTDICLTNGDCASSPILNCGKCVSGSVSTSHFDDPDESPWTTSPPIGGVGWQTLVTAKSPSPPMVLYYGNPKTLTYSSGDQANAGTATSPTLLISADAASAHVTFNVYADVEPIEPYDTLALGVIGQDGTSSFVWGKASLGQGFAPGWVAVKVDIGAFIGQAIQLQYRFDTVDAVQNDTMGILIDDVIVSQGCESCLSAAECDDGDPCTTDVCSGKKCINAKIPGCGGECQANPDCNDGNPCTEDYCGPTPNGVMACQHKAIPACCSSDIECQDGNPCTVKWCQQGQCVGQVLPDCCQSNAQCQDGDTCTQDLCVQGLCANPVVPGCGGECTTNEDCNDKNPCTSEGCANGLCVSKPLPNCCSPVQPCSDGNDCTSDFCVMNQCVFQPIPGCGVECKDAGDCGDANPCTADFCDNGKCVHKVLALCCTNDAQCQDDNFCTADGCAGNVCVHKPQPGCCVSNAECEDKNVCTNDTCVFGKCQQIAAAGCCLAASDCNDGNPCTTDACVNQKCTAAPIAGCCQKDADCDDKNACTKDTCSGGKCAPPAPIAGCCTADTQCDDAKACTADKCTANKCTHAAIANCCTVATDCSDNNACTTDACVAGACAFNAVAGCCTANAQCNDGNSCTADTCVAAVDGSGKCASTPTGVGPGCCTVATDCEDGDVCTLHSCKGGTCQTVPRLDCCKNDAACDDGVPCTENKCVLFYCKTTPAPGCCASNADCNDNIACTTDTCDVTTGACTYAKAPGCCTLDVDCADTNICTADKCVNSACSNAPVVGCCTTAADCKGAGPCQTATCTASQCFYATTAGCCTTNADCEDGNACTTNTCTGGQCSSAPKAACCNLASECVDADKCTIDTCEKNVCVHAADPSPACCKPANVYTQFFGSGPPKGWTTTKGEGSEAGWQIGTLQAKSVPGSWWFGNPATGDFASGNGQLPSSGTSTTASIALPAAKGVLVTFGLWLDIEEGQGFDNLELRVLSGADDAGKLVWDKSALQPGSMQQWLSISINVTAWAGKSVQLRWSFDSVDGLYNEGQGVFIDDLVVKTSCTELEGTCVFAGECDDGKVCTIDQCTAGTCTHSDIPDCCTSNAQCDDGYLCTADACGSDGQCKHEQKVGCCQFDGECNDGNACTADACVANICAGKPIPGKGCCTAASECEDKNACTTDQCINFKCAYKASPDPACCTAGALLVASFDDATLQGFSVIQDTSGAFWSVQGKRSFSAPFSLYYGIPGKWVYQTQGQSSGTARSKAVAVPLTASKATLSLQVYLDITGGGFGGDQVAVKVLSGTTLKTHWTSDQAPGNVKQWVAVTLEVSEYKGKTIQVELAFTSAQQPFGQGGEGVYVDNVSLTTTCN